MDVGSTSIYRSTTSGLPVQPLLLLTCDFGIETEPALMSAGPSSSSSFIYSKWLWQQLIICLCSRAERTGTECCDNCPHRVWNFDVITRLPNRCLGAKAECLLYFACAKEAANFTYITDNFAVDEWRLTKICRGTALTLVYSLLCTELL